MGSNAGKKQRQQQKRQQKKHAAQRARSGSPYLRIGHSGELVACYINHSWSDAGQAAIYILRQVPGGGHAMAAFLVDLWCAGLKDAWGRLDITCSEFDEAIRDRMPEETELVRVDLETARRLVAGGIRFAERNGFRLPRHYRRWAALLGDLGDSASADLSDFGMDGRLRYLGSMEDLKHRLVGCSVDEFLAREDVDFVFRDDDFTLLDDDQLVVEEVASTLADRAFDKAREWCFANGLVPHPRLRDAVELTLKAALQVDTVPEEGEPDDETGAAGADNLDRFLCLETPRDERELSEALAQFASYTRQYENPEDMITALGVDDLFGEYE